MRKSQLAAAVSAAVGALVLVPGAAAHAVLVKTDPPNDAVVEASPSQVALTFDERVETALGSIRVYDASGQRVDAQNIIRPTPAEVAVSIDDELASGTYTVGWRVISGD